MRSFRRRHGHRRRRMRPSARASHGRLAIRRDLLSSPLAQFPRRPSVCCPPWWVPAHAHKLRGRIDSGNLAHPFGGPPLRQFDLARARRCSSAEVAGPALVAPPLSPSATLCAPHPLSSATFFGTGFVFSSISGAISGSPRCRSLHLVASSLALAFFADGPVVGCSTWALPEGLGWFLAWGSFSFLPRRSLSLARRGGS